MIKYTRKLINKNPDRFRKTEFVVYEDVVEVMEMLVGAAVKAGADESKLMEFFEDNPD